MKIINLYEERKEMTFRLIMTLLRAIAAGLGIAVGVTSNIPALTIVCSMFLTIFIGQTYMKICIMMQMNKVIKKIEQEKLQKENGDK